MDVNAYINELEHPPLRQHVLKVSGKARARTCIEAAGKLCERGADGQFQLRHDPPLFWRHVVLDRRWTSDIDWRDLSQKMLDSYLCSVPAEVRHRLQHYRLVDAAMKAVGVGSVGTRCAISLFVGPTLKTS
ncbi:DUF2252 family protein [Cyanobium sp. Tous-M-B4]|nr:DUF2252 family protein [Cyanobium sp. Tous-M-B4]MCP9877259.1 DUF2252 family protein [Cyanobium sp. A2C-AMD]